MRYGAICIGLAGPLTVSQRHSLYSLLLLLFFQYNKPALHIQLFCLGGIWNSDDSTDTEGKNSQFDVKGMISELVQFLI